MNRELIRTAIDFHAIALPSLMCVCGALFCANAARATTPNGQWAAVLETPGGSLRFEMELDQRDGNWSAAIINGPERIEVPKVTVEDEKIVVNLAHYDSKIEATYDASNDSMQGTWTKRRGIDKLAKLGFSAARPAPANRMRPLVEPYLGRWRVQFSSDEAPAVGIFQRDEQGKLWGTFQTTVGDYRYLTAAIVDKKLELSCFDGGHAFLMRADAQADGSLTGDFWSGDWWHETWTAVRDEKIELPNAFELTKWNENISLATLEFPDLDGRMQKIIDEEHQGKPLILEIFGSWCPNCHDAGKYLAEVSAKYEERDLRVIGLAFELTGDLKRDAKQVDEYQKRNGLEFPVYICGLADKEQATAQFPALDRVRAYPTLVFVDRQQQVRAVYTGFSGPATGEQHERLKEKFETIIEEIVR